MIYKTALLAMFTGTIYAGLFVIFAIPIAMAMPFYLVHEMLTGKFGRATGFTRNHAGSFN